MHENCNCIVCAHEFNSKELENISHLNSTKFKICQNCINLSDPSEDYKQAKEIISSYLKNEEAYQLFLAAQMILDNR